MKKALAWLPERPQPIFVRYLFTLLLTAMCFIGMRYVEAASGVSSFFLLYPAVFLAAVLFDRGSGFLATAVATALLVGSTLYQTSELPQNYWLPISLFFFVGLGLAASSEALRKGWEKAVEEEKSKDLLYRELGHRTKNDFTMATAVLRLQARNHSEPAAKQALTEAVGRLNALGQAHEHLSRSESFEGVPVGDYLQAVCERVSDLAHVGDTVRLTVESDDIVLPPRRAVPLGFIVNELVTNAYKHAFEDGETGRVNVAFRRDQGLTLLVEDNGRGCTDKDRPGLGSELVKRLVAQLGGTIETQPVGPGCRVRVNFPEQAG